MATGREVDRNGRVSTSGPEYDHDRENCGEGEEKDHGQSVDSYFDCQSTCQNPAKDGKEKHGENVTGVPLPDRLPAPNPQTQVLDRVLYQPLKADEIRLVNFGAQRDDPVIIHANIGSPPEYIAISYCWGVENCLHPFELNGQVLILTSSLYMAFTEIALRGIRKMVWADAICIDQANTKEKAFQIPLMSQVYGKAQEVIVWLGQSRGSITTDCRMSSLLNCSYSWAILSMAEEIRKFDSHLQRPTAESGCGRKGCLTSSIEDSTDSFGRLPWLELGDVLCNSWVDRLWVVPEAVLASELRIWYGSLSVSLSELDEATKSIYIRPELHKWSIISADRTNARLQSWQDLISLRQARKERCAEVRKWDSMSSFIQLSRTKEASCPQDKVYALLSIMPLSLRKTIEVNVCASPQQVYIQAAQVMAKRKPVGLLSHVEWISRLDRLPSWVPDWSSALRQDTFTGRHNIWLHKLTAHKLTHRIAMKYFGLPRRNLHDTEMCLVGRQIDLVTGVQQIDETLCPDDCSDVGANSIRNIILLGRQCLKLVKREWTGDQGQLQGRVCVDRLPYFDYAVVATLLHGSYRTVDRAQENKRLAELMDSCEPLEYPDFHKFAGNARVRYTRRHSFLITRDFRLGLGPASIETGDRIVLFPEAECSYVLRRRPDRDTSLFIGSCFLGEGVCADMLHKLMAPGVLGHTKKFRQWILE